MKTTFNKWMQRGAWAIGALVLFSACADDHFDVKGASDKTLWESVESNPQLTDFAALLKRTKVMKSEDDRTATLTAAELLAQNQSFTMWAPLNGTFNPKAWNDTLDVAATYLSSASEADRKKGREIQYYVWQQLVANHIARFNHEGAAGEQTIRLLNNKRATATAKTFNGVAMKGDDVAASNGQLHILNGVSPFSYNIYDYLSANKDISSLNAYIKDPSVDHVKFSDERSVPGAMNEHGKMVYIDSVYTYTNDLLDHTGAQIANEDSTYIALIPNNTAWKEGLEKVGELFKYGAAYSYDWNGTSFNNNKGNARQYRLDKKSSQDASRTLADSLADRNVRENIVFNLFFAPHHFQNIDLNDSAALIHYAIHADSLISTTGTIFYNAGVAPGAALNTTPNPALKDLKPYRASNGYIFNLEHFTFDPAYSFVGSFRFQPSTSPTYYTASPTSNNAVVRVGSTINLTEDNYNRYRPKLAEDGTPVLDPLTQKPVYVGVEGEVEGKVFQRYEMASEKSDMVLDFRLNPVYSTGYTIKAIMVPTKISLDHFTEGDPEEVVKFTAQIVDDNDVVDKAHTVTIDQGAGQFSQDKVNEIVLWKNYVFPKCYVGLGREKVSFPRLRFTLPKKGRGDIKCKALNIVKIIVEPYRGE